MINSPTENSNQPLTVAAYGHNLVSGQTQHLVFAITKTLAFWALVAEKMGQRGAVHYSL